jgi:hypothetical protein
VRSHPWLLWLLVVLVAAGLLIGACSEADAPTATPSATETATSEPTAGPSATVDAGAVVLRWSREGGIAGFCDGLVLTAGHAVTLGTCEDTISPDDGDIAPDDLILEMERFRSDYASFDRVWEDDAVADGMTVRLSFVGRGDTVADEKTQLAIAEFASRLFVAIQAMQPRAASVGGR